MIIQNNHLSFSLSSSIDMLVIYFLMNLMFVLLIMTMMSLTNRSGSRNRSSSRNRSCSRDSRGSQFSYTDSNCRDRMVAEKAIIIARLLTGKMNDPISLF